MSIYDKASLVQIPSGYKSGTLYSVVPNTADGDFTVTGDPQGEATRVNKDGLIETVSANAPRLNYNFIDGVVQPDPHLLLEPTRRNIVDYSEEFDQWSATNSVTVTTNQGTSPDGSNTSDKLTSGAANSRVNRTFTYSNNSTMVFSVFVKNIDATNIKIGISDNITGVCNATFTFSNENITSANEGSWTNTSASVVNFGNGWYRLILISTKGAGSNLASRVEFTESGKNVLVWGAQLEDNGSFGSVDYPTSYIPTSGSAVTRTADFCQIASGIADILNTSEGTLFIDVEVPRVSTSGDYERIALTDQTSGTDRILIDDFGGNWRVVVISSAGTQTASIRSTQANTRIKIAFTYSSSQIRVSYDGNDATTTSISYTPSTALESFKFSNKDGNNKWQGKVYQAMYFDTALTNTELQTLTSYDSFGQMAKALLYTIE